MALLRLVWSRQGLSLNEALGLLEKTYSDMNKTTRRHKNAYNEIRDMYRMNEKRPLNISRQEQLLILGNFVTNADHQNGFYEEAFNVHPIFGFLRGLAADDPIIENLHRVSSLLKKAIDSVRWRVLRRHASILL
jgi:hypothetical protein